MLVIGKELYILCAIKEVWRGILGTSEKWEGFAGRVSTLWRREDRGMGKIFRWTLK